jgi:hypothetical protein
LQLDSTQDLQGISRKSGFIENKKATADSLARVPAVALRSLREPNFSPFNVCNCTLWQTEKSLKRSTLTGLTRS